MRTVWSGTLSFGLVNIPVKMYSASHSDTLNLDMLSKDEHCPISFKRVCRSTGKEVPYEDIVKGYEYQQGDYVVLTDEDFEKANVKKTKSIEIMDFVDESEIDPMYYEKPYYLEPDKSGDRIYALLREALKKSGKVGIASFAMRNRGHIAAIKCHENVIVLNQLRFHSEINDYSELDLPHGKVLREKEMEMAMALIDQLTTKFTPGKYKDTYVEDLKRIIDEKAHGRRPKPKEREPKPTRVIDIMTMLKKSLRHRKGQAA